MTQQLIRYEAACAALAECKAVDEVKAWADKAAAMQAYGRMAQDKGLEVDAAEIRIRAERRLGEMLAQQKADGGLASGVRMAGAKPGANDGSSAVVGNDRRPEAPKLADAGISKDLSSRAQKLAAVPPAEFEAEVGQWRERVTAEGQRVTHRLEKAGEREQKKTAKQAQAEQNAADAYGVDDPAALLEDAQRELEQMTALLKVAEADDQKAEALKWRRAYDNAVRQQNEAMEKSANAQKREAFTKRQLMRCGKAVGQEDPDKIAAAVEAFVRAQKVQA